MTYIPQVGDICLEKSDRFMAKFVMFLMTAPTIYQWIWRAIRKTNEKVKYYHVTMIYDRKRIAEQQSKVEINDWSKNTKQIIFRNRYLTRSDKIHLVDVVDNDLGKGYDVLSCIGKTLTWLTGIPYFARYVEWPGAEICINRVTNWYRKVKGETFGSKTNAELTTHKLYKYLKENSDQWQIVYEST